MRPVPSFIDDPRPFLVRQGRADAERERTLRQRYGFSMDYKDISERVALLTQEIRDLQEIDAQYSNFLR